MCGGSASESFGESEISYKANGTYNNYEACVWRVIPNSRTTNIRFTLLQDGFETGYDYLIIATFEDYNTTNIQVQAQLYVFSLLVFFSLMHA